MFTIIIFLVLIGCGAFGCGSSSANDQAMMNGFVIGMIIADDH